MTHSADRPNGDEAAVSAAGYDYDQSSDEGRGSRRNNDDDDTSHGNDNEDNIGNIAPPGSKQRASRRAPPPDVEDEDDVAPHTPREQEPDEYVLSVRMSKSLYKKLQYTAQDEMVPLDDFAGELLAEGLVLRAWEIMERKSAMRGGGPGHGAPHGNQRHGGGGNGNQRHGNHQGGKGGNNRHHRQGSNRQNTRAQNHANTLNLMEDKAAFLEYVRNQERKRR
jgi:hypothetical protein